MPKGLNLEQPHSNLFIKGWGMDTNGNSVIIVGFPNDRGFAIQINKPEFRETKNIVRSAKRELSDDELFDIGKEVTDWVKKFGTQKVKSRLKVYDVPDRYTESNLIESGLRKIVNKILKESKVSKKRKSG